MYGRPRRHLSQASYQLVQEIRRENERQKQIDAGFGYRPHALEQDGISVRPLHIGPQIEMVPIGDRYEAV